MIRTHLGGVSVTTVFARSDTVNGTPSERRREQTCVICKPHVRGNRDSQITSRHKPAHGESAAVVGPAACHRPGQVRPARVIGAKDHDSDVRGGLTAACDGSRTPCRRGS